MSCQENYTRIGVRKLLRIGLVSARVWRSSLGHFAHRKVEVEAEGGGTSKQERIGFALSLSTEVNGLEVEEQLSTMATLFSAEGVWMNRAVMCETRDF